MKAEFLRQVQAAGWNILTADETDVWVGCPRAGCNLTTRMRDGGLVPASCRPLPVLAEIVVEQFDDARRELRGRREQLCLSIKDVEEAAGIAGDFLAKFEKDEVAKIPNAQTFIEWVQALGYTVVLRPTGLPPYALRIISDTRKHVVRRKATSRHFNRVRQSRAAD